MPYLHTVQSMDENGKFREQLLGEFDSLRRELDDIRAAFMSLRALLVAATAVGAGYNTVATNLGTTTPLTVAAAPRFNRTT